MSKTANTSWIHRISIGIVVAAAPLALALGVDTTAQAKVPPFDSGFVLLSDTNPAPPATPQAALSKSATSQTAPTEIAPAPHLSVRTFGFDY